MNASQLIAGLVKEKTRTGTNYAAAKALGISPSNFKEVLDGRRNLGVEALFRAAAILDREPRELLVEVQHDSAKTPEKKAFWEKYRPRLLPTVAIWGLIVGVTQFTDSEARTGLTTARDNLYIMRSWLRRITRAALRLRNGQSAVPRAWA